LIFVTVGNSHNPFQRLIRAADDAAARLDEPVVIQSGHSPRDTRHARCVPFLGLDEYEAQARQSRLIVAHAGSGSVITAFRHGKPLILMARRKRFGEHVNDHQLELAGALRGDERVRVVESAEELWHAIQTPPSGRPAGTGTPPLLGVLGEWLERFAASRHP
jgi:UDP-N-acetylglucosamine transferase subunit ALG13